MRGSADRSFGVAAGAPACVMFMIVFPSVHPPKVTECQMPWLMRKLGRGDTPGSGHAVIAG
ncbi:hypothetical protein GCM10009601_13560 [Streptomyces thermospinosisporus]|uniref:Uncharacterized protein n=2 Tax=Streptomyces TaxID=1883 RepID=A0ABN1YMV3_9ACTN